MSFGLSRKHLWFRSFHTVHQMHARTIFHLSSFELALPSLFQELRTPLMLPGFTQFLHSWISALCTLKSKPNKETPYPLHVTHGEPHYVFCVHILLSLVTSSPLVDYFFSFKPFQIWHLDKNPLVLSYSYIIFLIFWDKFPIFLVNSTVLPFSIHRQNSTYVPKIVKETRNLIWDGIAWKAERDTTPNYFMAMNTTSCHKNFLCSLVIYILYELVKTTS